MAAFRRIILALALLAVFAAIAQAYSAFSTDVRITGPPGIFLASIQLPATCQQVTSTNGFESICLPGDTWVFDRDGSFYVLPNDASPAVPTQVRPFPSLVASITPDADYDQVIPNISRPREWVRTPTPIRT